MKVTGYAIHILDQPTRERLDCLSERTDLRVDYRRVNSSLPKSHKEPSCKAAPESRSVRSYPVYRTPAKHDKDSWRSLTLKVIDGLTLY